MKSLNDKWNKILETGEPSQVLKLWIDTRDFADIRSRCIATLYTQELTLSEIQCFTSIIHQHRASVHSPLVGAEVFLPILLSSWQKLFESCASMGGHDALLETYFAFGMVPILKLKAMPKHESWTTVLETLKQSWHIDLL